MDFSALGKRKLIFPLILLVAFLLLIFNIYGFLYLRKGKEKNEFGLLVKNIKEIRGAKSGELAEEIAKKEVQELSVLRSEASKLGISLSQSELSPDPGLALYQELEKLRGEITKRVVNWRSGGYIKARFDTSGIGPEIEEEAKKKAKELLEKYYERAKREEGIEELIAEANQDAELAKINRNEENQTFEYLNFDKKIWDDEKFNQVVFSLQTGEVSDIFTLSMPWKTEGKSEPFTYIFVKITDAGKGQYQNYQEWFNAVKKSYE